MNGIVDEFSRALVTLSIRANQDAKPTDIQAWIDTAPLDQAATADIPH